MKRKRSVRQQPSVWVVERDRGLGWEANLPGAIWIYRDLAAEEARELDRKAGSHRYRVAEYVRLPQRRRKGKG